MGKAIKHIGFKEGKILGNVTVVKDHFVNSDKDEHRLFHMP